MKHLAIDSLKFILGPVLMANNCKRSQAEILQPAAANKLWVVVAHTYFSVLQNYEVDEWTEWKSTNVSDGAVLKAFKSMTKSQNLSSSTKCYVTTK